MPSGSERRADPPRERGALLAEIIVAAACFAILIVMTAMLYASMARYQKRVAADAAQQQTGRSALERIVDDLRRAGLNVDPDDAGRPDEGFEGTWSTACALRLDEDMADDALRDSPEALLAGGTYEVVPTGNDEIVVWALGQESAFEFLADVEGVPRDGTVESVRVAPTASTAPRTLYRMSVMEGRSAMTRQPVIDDCLSLRFEYFDARGRPLAPAEGGDAPAAREARARIASVAVRLGIASDRAAGQSPGTLLLETRVGIRNTGLFGGIGPGRAP